MNQIFQDNSDAVENHDAEEAPQQFSRRSIRKGARGRRRRRTLVFFLVLVAFAVVCVLGFIAIKPLLSFDTAKDYPGPGTEQVAYQLKQGSTPRSVGQDLVSLDVVASENAFVNALTDADGASKLLPGNYELKKQMKASDSVQVFLAASSQQVHYAPIERGLWQDQVFQKLSDATGIDISEFQKLAKTPQAFGLPANAPSLEGYLAPGDYRFPVNASAKDILTTMVNTTLSELKADGITNPADQFRVVTIASIIEAEGQERYYKQISGAIENRINNQNGETGGRLESDATVAYGLGKRTYNLTSAEKADTSNPYNTFAKKGLPIGPIGSPTQSSIDAAAHPDNNNYYFWVTVNLDTGETLFASTYAEHQENVKKYTQWCTANPGRCK